MLEIELVFFFRVVKYWNRLLGEVVESLSLRMFKERFKVGCGTYGHGLVGDIDDRWTVEPHDLEVSSNFNDSDSNMCCCN